MSSDSGGKRAQVAASLRRDILRGTLRPGEQLAGENELARRFDVSRGTLRGALEQLKQDQLIATHTGVGSFVTYGGRPLPQSNGWAEALATAGDFHAEVLSIEAIELTGPDVFTGPGIRIRRLRRDIHAVAISYEVATVPAIRTLRDLPRTGLRDGSLTKSLADAGLVAAKGVQELSLAHLDPSEALILGREPNVAFLRSERTSTTATGQPVEHVISLLDPDHFRLSLTFGEDQ